MPTEVQEVPAQDNGHSPPEQAERKRVSTAASSGTGRVLGVSVVILGIVLAAGFVIAYIARARSEAKAKDLADAVAESKPVVDVVAAKASDRAYPLALPGDTAGWYQSTIFARVDGYVGSWTADIGDRVKKDQALAVIDTPELDQQLNAADAKTAASQAQVKLVEAKVSIAKITYERWRDSPKGVVSEQEREDKKAGYDEAVAELAAANAQMQLDQADVGRLEAMEKFKTVRAPYDGIITGRKVDVGDLVSAGSSASTTSLYTIAQSNVIRVFVDVPQKAAAQMTDGLAANVTTNQFPGRVFEGKVARSAMAVDPQTRTQRTEVDIPNPDLALVPGMYVDVAFQLNQNGLPEVPAAAIMFKPSGLQVAVVNDESKIEFRPVTVAKDNGDTVVLATGLKVGERVALNLSSAITGGEEVKMEEAGMRQ